MATVRAIEYSMQQQKNGNRNMYNLSFVYTFRKESILEMRIRWLWLDLAFWFPFHFNSFVLSGFAYGTKKYEILMRMDLSRFMKMQLWIVSVIFSILWYSPFWICSIADGSAQTAWIKIWYPSKSKVQIG